MAQMRFKFDDETSDMELTDEQQKYTKKVEIPQYEIKGILPKMYELYDLRKWFKLKQKIERCKDITEEQKQFLIFASTRHIAFNYEKIAEYYAHQNKEMQELMEENALVIIDFEDAIANGYAMLAEEIDKMSEEDYYEI